MTKKIALIFRDVKNVIRNASKVLVCLMKTDSYEEL